MSASEHDPVQQGMPQDHPAEAAAELSLGARFRAARQARGLDIAAVASALRAPQAKIEAIEADELDRLGAKVFARGYLLSYARLVGLPTVAVEVALSHREQPEVPLNSSVHVPRSHYLLDRYARKGAYLVLTASIALPLIWLANRDQLPIEQLGLRSLDTPVEPIGVPAREPGESAPVVGEAGNDMIAARQNEGDDEDVTVMASLAPFYGQRPASPRADEVAEAPAARSVPVVAGSTGWKLRLQQESWVEITDVDGRRLEFGLLPAGAERQYPADRVASVLLGNATGAQWLQDGDPVDLAPFRRANVARFTVSSDGRLRPSGN
jgi:cytoskeleton protein RodZ